MICTQFLSFFFPYSFELNHYVCDSIKISRKTFSLVILQKKGLIQNHYVCFISLYYKYFWSKVFQLKFNKRKGWSLVEGLKKGGLLDKQKGWG